MKAEPFTAGPWAVSKQKARRVTASGVVICNAVLRNRGGPKHKADLKDEHEAEANACLIAASPDLLAACRALVAYDEADDSAPDAGVKMMVDYDHALTLARAAIGKAVPA